MNAYTRLGIRTDYLRRANSANRQLIDVVRTLQQLATETNDAATREIVQDSVSKIVASLDDYSALIDHAIGETP